MSKHPLASIYALNTARDDLELLKFRLNNCQLVGKATALRFLELFDGPLPHLTGGVKREVIFYWKDWYLSISDKMVLFRYPVNSVVHAQASHTTEETLRYMVACTQLALSKID